MELLHKPSRSESPFTINHLTPSAAAARNPVSSPSYSAVLFVAQKFKYMACLNWSPRVMLEWISLLLLGCWVPRQSPFSMSPCPFDRLWCFRERSYRQRSLRELETWWSCARQTEHQISCAQRPTLQCALRHLCSWPPCPGGKNRRPRLLPGNSGATSMISWP